MTPCFLAASTHKENQLNWRDNQSSLLVASTPGKHRSSLRHLELHAFAIKDLVDDGEISVVWCAGDDCIADVFTKAVDSGFDKVQKV